MSVVRPFAALVVRPEFARRLVAGLAELPEDTGTLPPVKPIDPAQYVAHPPALYVYRQGDHTGVVCEVGIRAFVPGGQARGHEAVQAQRVQSLVRHLETDAPPALVALLHHVGPTYTDTVAALVATEPVLDFDGPGGLRQQVWPVPAGPATDALVAELSAADHYIADGHHRVAASLEAWRRRGEPEDAAVLCVLHPMDGLDLSAFHRRVTGPVDVPALLALLEPGFTVEPVASRAHTSGCFGLYADHAWRIVTPRTPSDALDVQVLQNRVLDPLGQRVEIAPAHTLVEELARRCDADDGVLFTLAPPSLDALTGLADAGRVMPPKATYFEPKPVSGIFRRP